jgi:hypothetical protein
MKLNNCKKHDKPPFSFLWASHSEKMCKWIVRCPACKGLNDFESEKIIFKVIYSDEIDYMRKETEEKWNENNPKERIK